MGRDLTEKGIGRSDMPAEEGDRPETPFGERLAAMDLSRLMPMFLLVDACGVICSAGPTIAQVCGPKELIGRSFSEVFLSTRGGALPKGALDPRSGGTLHLSLHDHPDTSLRALVIPASWSGDPSVIHLALPGVSHGKGGGVARRG